MPYERDGLCVYKLTDNGREVVACHETEGEAEAHLTALRVNVEKAISPEGFAYASLANDPQVVAIMRQLQMEMGDEGIEWQPIPTLHISLVYSPQAKPEQLIQIGRAIHLYSVLPVESQTLGVFENGDERALHLVVDRNDRLDEIQQQVYTGFGFHGLEISEYSQPETWKPHITLAYLPPGVEVPEQEIRLGTFSERVVIGRGDYEPLVEVRSPVDQSIRPLAERAVDTGLRALSATKAAPEQRLMLLITSNAYRDREDEIIKEDALRAWVKGAWQGDQYIEPHTDHLWWHGGDPIGTIVFSDMEGPFLIEVSREAEDAVINLADDGEDPYEVKVSELWDALEGRTDQGASHRFAFRAGDEKDGVYEAIVKVESSTLPRDRAANAWTLSYVVRKGDDMTQVRLPILDKLLGREGNGEAVAEMVAEATSELDAQGIERKSLKSPESLQAWAEKVWADIELGSIELPDSFGAVVTQAMADGAAELLRINQEVAAAAQGATEPAPAQAMRQTTGAEDTPPPVEDEEKQTAEEVAMTLAEGVFAATSGDLSALTAEDLAAILAGMLQPVDSGEEMPMQGEAARSLASQAEKDMLDYIAQSTKDMGELAGVMAEMIKGQKANADAIQAIQDQIGNRPRQASTEKDTDVEALLGEIAEPEGDNPASKAISTLRAELNKGLNGQKKVLGITVTE